MYANNIIRGTGSLPGSVSINSIPLSQIFVNPVETPGLANLYPIAGSPLIDAGSNTYAAAVDFNGVARPQAAAADVGLRVLQPGQPRLAVGDRIEGADG